MTGRHPVSEGACTHQHLRHPPAGRPLGALLNPFLTCALLHVTHLACTTVEVRVETSHEIPANHWCTHVLQDVDLDETRMILKACLGWEVALNAGDQRPIKVDQRLFRLLKNVSGKLVIEVITGDSSALGPRIKLS